MAHGTAVALVEATPMTTRSRKVVFAALLALSTAAVAGCDDGVCDAGTVTVQEVHCGHTGAVQVTSPTFALPATADAVQAVSCLDTAGTCGAPARVEFAAYGTPGTNSIALDIEVAPGSAPGTYGLDGNETGPVTITGYLNSADYPRGGTLVVLSGQVVITGNDAAGFAGTFAIEGETEDQLHRVSLTGGRFQAGGCAVEPHTYCAE
jgi:hypothetical protein